MGAPLLSIITPCLNSAATLPQTLASVREQGLGDAVEHVVVDGGSSDGTVDLLRAAPGVDWTSEPDRGLSDAMNKGTARARGEYIGWLNADDFYLPGALERVRGAADARPIWITGPCLIVDANNREIRRLVTLYKRFFLRHYDRRSLLVQNYIAAPATFVRRDALLAAGGFDERFKYSMDYDLWLRVSRRGRPLVIDQPLSAFRMAGDSLSMTGYKHQFREHAQNAREHGDGHPLAVRANLAISRLIALTYTAMNAVRGR